MGFRVISLLLSAALLTGSISIPQGQGTGFVMPKGLEVIKETEEEGSEEENNRGEEKEEEKENAKQGQEEVFTKTEEEGRE